ncbi:uncharacterized protein V6R79_007549 [Siganus canaliculatus]
MLINEMTEEKNETNLLRYYCTAGNGMEPFLIDEVKTKLAAIDICQMPGKVIFSSSAEINKISELKAAERLFLLLKQDSPVCLSAHTSPAKAASVLQEKLLGDHNEWTKAVMTWSCLQGELAHRRTTVTPPGTVLGVTTKRKEGREGEEQRDEGEKCDPVWGRSTREQKEKTGRHGLQPLEKKRKRDNEEERTGEKKNESSVDMEFSHCRKNGEDAQTPGTALNVKDQETSRQDLVDDSSEKVDGVAKGSAVKSEEENGGIEAPLQPSRIKPQPSCTSVSFRVSCKCTGSLSRCFSSQEVSKVVGIGLCKRLGWKTDLKNPQLEVSIYLSDDHCLMGIPLTRIPLANRSYIKTTGLRSTVAWAMASLAQIQPGSFVVDPMCGVGTILMEAAQDQKTACFLGVDIDDGQLQKANENIEFAQLTNQIYLVKASSMALPLPNASVDAVVCDLPFGRKFGTKTNMTANLPLILIEMERVLCVGGTLVLLLSPQLSCLLKKTLARNDSDPASNKETESLTRTQNCLSPSLSTARQQTLEIHQGINSSTDQIAVCQSELQRSGPRPLSSLQHQATLRVSLGLIDGLIHKYVKTDT